MILETREERIKLLRSGFTGNQVEALFFVLNRFEDVGVDWDEAATKSGIQTNLSPIFLVSFPLVKAAPSQKVWDEAVTKCMPRRTPNPPRMNSLISSIHVYAAPSLG